MVPTLYSIDDVSLLTQSPRNTVIFWIRTGRLNALKVGRRRMVTEPALLRFLGVPEIDMEPRASAAARSGR